MRLKLLFAFAAILSFSIKAKAQCEVNIEPNQTITIVCGEVLPIELSAFGNTFNYILDNDFNSGSPGSGWQATTAATFTNPCVNSPDGTIYMWMGDASQQPRTLTTQSFDLSLGGSICFELRFAIQAEAPPCEGPDLSDEGVYLQYSTNGGTNWTNIHYFDPNGGYDTLLTNWREYCFQIPAAAQTPNTQIRWFQDATSGNEYDHWGLDNVQMFLNDPNYNYVWSHNGFIGQYPDTVFVSSDTTFTVYYTDGTDTCQASLDVVTTLPTFEVSISDTSLCNTDCVELTGTAKVILYEDTIRTFENIEGVTIEPGIIGPATSGFDLNIAGMRQQVVDANTIVSACVTINDPDDPFLGAFFSFFFDLGAISIKLKCPEGNTVNLVPQGSLSGATMINACFQENASSTINSGTEPYTGTWIPASGNFGNLLGCSTNGIWTMEVTVPSLFDLGGGFPSITYFNSWSLSLFDPEISYPADFVWSPTENMTNSNTLHPTLCDVTDPTDITLTVSDTNNCASEAFIANITHNDNNNLEITNADITETNCNSSEGAIDLTISGLSDQNEIYWSNGTQGTPSISGLTPGVYEVRLYDVCFVDSTFVIGGIGGPEITDVQTTNPSDTGMADGTITVSATGEPPLTYSLNNTAGQTSNTFSDLPPGTYDILVTDANGCIDYISVTLDTSDANEEIFISNVFNPGSNVQANTIFTVKGMTSPNVVIYNRWGRKIYENSSYQNDWDGDNYKDGVYYYVVKDNAADGQYYKGFFQLLRNN